jgi:hypothetical protein
MNLCNKLVFANSRPFQHSLMFASKGAEYPSELLFQVLPSMVDPQTLD